MKSEQKEMSEKRRELKIVFKDKLGQMRKRMKIGRIIKEGIMINEKKIYEKESERREKEEMREVGMEKEMRKRYKNEFQGGKRKRIEIERKMIMKKRVIVIDEKKREMDSQVKKKIVKMLRDLKKDKGI